MFSRLGLIIIIVFTHSIQFSCTYSAVDQCPGIDVNNVKRNTESHEISVLFYYTQWSTESVEALQQFNDVASFFGDKVYFAAIDCWHLSCNCSNTFLNTMGSGSPHKWPTLFVHYGRGGQLRIQYNGLFTFQDMTQFIIHVMQPLERIEERESLEKMKSFADAIILGVFESTYGLEYQQYLIASLKWLDSDPKRSYRFTITFVNANENLNDSKVQKPNLLFLGQITKKSFADYSDFKWNSSNILRWLHEEFNNDYSRMHAYSNPITITKKVKKQPVLAVFVNQPKQFFSYMEKYIDHKRPFTKAQLMCDRLKKRAIIKNRVKSDQFSEILQNFKFYSDGSKCHYYDKNIVLKNLNLYYEINQHFGKHAISAESNYKSSLKVQELLNFYQTTACLQMQDSALQTPLHISVAKKLESYMTNEQQCKNSNRSLAVAVLDTQRYKDFLENLDISPTHKSMATVFIIDNDKEHMHVMEDHFAMYNLMEFVKNYYLNELNNFYKNKENMPAITSQPYSSALHSDYDIALKQLNRALFLNYLQYTHNQTLVVLIHSPDCALCGNIQHSFLQLSLSLRHIKDLKFLRINTMYNDLPWQFNMPFLPALLVFTENRFSDSRIFPTHLKPDIRNLFGFILSQLPAQQQVTLVLTMCQSGTLPQSHTQNCWQFAETLLMQHLGKHLQYWQMFKDERNVIFERLRAFKDMSLDIQRNLRL